MCQNHMQERFALLKLYTEYFLTVLPNSCQYHAVSQLLSMAPSINNLQSVFPDAPAYRYQTQVRNMLYH